MSSENSPGIISCRADYTCSFLADKPHATIRGDINYTMFSVFPRPIIIFAC